MEDGKNEPVQRLKGQDLRRESHDEVRGKQGEKRAKAFGREQQSVRGEKSGKKRHQISVLDQWVEIELSADGKTVTTLYPPNEILMQEVQKKSLAPELVYRRMNFIGRVPDEYAWATDNQAIRENGGMGIQRMEMNTWLELIEREKELGTGHLSPCESLPRPEERGGCECPLCAKNRAWLEGITESK